MQNPILNRFAPLPLGVYRLKNRVVVPAMASETADAQGLATPATQRRYEDLAQAGAGIVMVEYSFVARSGRSEPNQLGADLDSGIPGLASIARAIHATGAVAILQLTHSGGK